MTASEPVDPLAILDRLPVPLGVLQGPGDQVLLVNRCFTESFGYGADDLPTVGDWWTRAFPNWADRQRTQVAWRAWSQRGGGSPSHPFEARITCKDGTEREVLFRLASLDDLHIVVLEDVGERRRAERELAFLAFHDPLTALPNRMLFYDRFHLAIRLAWRRQKGFALLLADLDGFKAVNDRFGHEVGDLALKQVAARFQGALRASDTVARVGGDAFACLLPDTSAVPDIEAVAGKLLEGLQEPLDLGAERVSVGCSLGIARFPEDGDTMDLLLAQAEGAMAAAKALGTNRFVHAGGTEGM